MRFLLLILVLVGALAAPVIARAAPGPPVYVVSEAAGTVSAVDTASGNVDPPIRVGSLPQAVALAPDGSHAYVTNWGSGTVSVIDTVAGTVARQITVGLQDHSRPSGLAVSPDGATLAVTYGYRSVTPSCPGDAPSCPGEVALIHTATGEVTQRIGVGDVPAGIAITPDGSKAFVAAYGSGLVTEITGLDTCTPAACDATAAPPINVGGTPQSVAVTPDGKTVYVTNGASNSVAVIDAVSGKLTSTLTDASFDAPQGVATSPNGGAAYVADFGAHRLSALDLATGTVTRPVALPVESFPFGLAYSPDGETVYATDSNAPGSVLTIDAAGGTLSGGPIAVHDDPLGLAVAPDQAPVADLSVTPKSAGAATVLDASASTVRYGTIASYAWSFGDGSSATTTTSSTTHVYAQPGDYTATVTATSSAGTSTSKVYTGQTMARNGAASAVATRSVTIVPPHAIAAVSPSALDFGTQTIGQGYAPKPVTLSNTGDAPLAVSTVSLDGASAGDFALAADACSQRTLGAGESCLVQVSFAPTVISGLGAKSARLTLADDVPDSPQTVALSGTSQAPGLPGPVPSPPAPGPTGSSADRPAARIAPARLSFGRVRVGAHGARRSATVTNMGAAPLKPTLAKLRGRQARSFAITADRCRGRTLASGRSCRVVVAFAPRGIGVAKARLVLDDDGPGAPQDVRLRGRGRGGRIALRPSKVRFGAHAVGQGGDARRITLLNTGNARVKPRLALAGRNAADFRVRRRCGAIAPRKRCTITVAFTPSAGGNRAARLIVRGGIGRRIVRLSGRGR